MATNYNIITVKGLRDILKDRRLEQRGLKAELIARLNNFDKQDAAGGGAQQVWQPSSQHSTPNQIGHAAGSQNLWYAMQSLNSIPGFTPTEAGRAVSTPKIGLNTPQCSRYTSQPAHQYSSSQGSIGQSSSQRAENAYYGFSSQPIYNDSSSQQASTPSMSHWSQPQSYQYSQSTDMPRGTGFSSTPSSVGRLPLADLPNNSQPSPSNHVRESAKKSRTHVPLADGEYLGYYDFEEKYLIHCRDTLDYDEFRKRRRQWLALLEIDIMPYQYIWNEEYKKRQVEEAWAFQLPEKRREVERKAIALKHNIHLDNIPMRTAPSHLIGPPPLSFTQLESIYFNVAERNFDGVDDTTQKRRHWLARLGLDDSIYQAMCQTSTQTVAVETVYSDKTIPERRAIEAKAKYLKVMLTPVTPSWHGLEKASEIYPRTAFTRHSDYSEKRREWLQLLELDVKPFRHVNLIQSDVDMEAVEVAWSECDEAKRKSVEDKAKMVKGGCNPILHSWDELEAVFGIIQEKERDFKDDPYGYDLKRRVWVQAIGLESEPYFKDQTASPIVRQEAWQLIDAGKRRSIIEKARAEKERYVRDKFRQQAEKKGSNYQAPTSLTNTIVVKATPKAVSKPWSSGWTSNSRVSKSSKPAKTSNFRHIPREQWSNWSGRRGPTGGYVTGGKLYAANGRYIRRADY